MVWQERIPIIVMLTDTHEAGVSKCVQYWPELNDTMELENGLLISCNHLVTGTCLFFKLYIYTYLLYTGRSKSYTIRDLFIVDVRTHEQWSVVHCQMHGWPDHGAPKQTKKFVFVLWCFCIYCCCFYID
jgi:protein tyrosine phosphatase